ncbi:MAG TPA: hypothetical protein VED66_15955 [Candidatus Sulfotelmatobacter sp.]|nr:hypothetical protein [Candidatus Sulfotelmatobacter sp.]
MRRILTLSRGPWQPTWRVCVSVLLIALVLYNPFAALNGSSGHLSYEKLARYRATIGAGELQHFSPVSNPHGQADLDADVDVIGTDPTGPIPESQAEKGQRELLLPEQALLTGVWFRPPPSL